MQCIPSTGCWRQRNIQKCAEHCTEDYRNRMIRLICKSALHWSRRRAECLAPPFLDSSFQLLVWSQISGCQWNPTNSLPETNLLWFRKSLQRLALALSKQSEPLHKGNDSLPGVSHSENLILMFSTHKLGYSAQIYTALKRKHWH